METKRAGMDAPRIVVLRQGLRVYTIRRRRFRAESTGTGVHQFAATESAWAMSYFIPTIVRTEIRFLTMDARQCVRQSGVGIVTPRVILMCARLLAGTGGVRDGSNVTMVTVLMVMGAARLVILKMVGCAPSNHTESRGVGLCAETASFRGLNNVMTEILGRMMDAVPGAKSSVDGNVRVAVRVPRFAVMECVRVPRLATTAICSVMTVARIRVR